MDDEVHTTKRPKAGSRKAAKPPLSFEEAREKILTKLQTQGAKGATAFGTKLSAADTETYQAAVAALADEQPPEVYIDRRGKKPKYFLWAVRPRLPAPLTVEEAKEAILTKLLSEGAKGATAFGTKLSAADAKTYQAAVAALADEQPPEVYIDLRGKSPKYFLWTFRPKLPTRESVGESLLQFARAEHPRIHSEATLKSTAVQKRHGLSKDELALLSEALQLLCDEAKLVPLHFTSSKTRTTVYVVPDQLGAAAPTPEAPEEAPLSATHLRQAYDALVRQSGFPAVPIARLASAAGVDLAALKEYFRAEYRAGSIVLSLGDWSIASEEERRGVIELHGERYLQVRWL
jgi:hypothetical protein